MLSLACVSSLSPAPAGAGDACDESDEIASLLHNVIGWYFFVCVVCRSHEAICSYICIQELFLAAPVISGCSYSSRSYLQDLLSPETVIGSNGVIKPLFFTIQEAIFTILLYRNMLVAPQLLFFLYAKKGGTKERFLY